jgi:hypothetical protein
MWELAHSPESAMKLSTILAALNIKYVLSPVVTQLAGWQKVFTSNGVEIWKNPAVLPRAFLVGQVESEDLEVRLKWEAQAAERLGNYPQMVDDWESRRADAQIVDHILNRGTDYRDVAVVDASLPPLTSGKPEFTVKNLTGSSADEMRFHVRTDRPALMVISNSYDPGWTATLNGATTPIFKADWILQGVYVPAGDSDVALRYNAPGWRIGLSVSTASILLLLSVIVILGKRQLVARNRWSGISAPALPN